MNLDQIDTTIGRGVSVRSFDFPDYIQQDSLAGGAARGCYVDGVVDDVCQHERQTCYMIKVGQSVYQGRPYIYDPPRTHIFIPVNGSRSGKRINNHVFRR